VEKVERQAIERRLPPGAVHQGLALQADPLPDVDLASAVFGKNLVLVLDQVQDPHNIGAILRSAAVFGAGAVVLQDRHSPAATGALAKSASGALERLPLVRVVNLARGLDELKDLGFWIVGLDAAGPERLDRIAGDRRIALVLGAEGAGLRRLSREACDILAKIPHAGGMASLNVSNAAAVALYVVRTALKD
jgi:23S rRNA (guanosine2251-2'-O)-methyltransferase